MYGSHIYQPKQEETNDIEQAIISGAGAAGNALKAGWSFLNKGAKKVK